MASDEPQTSKKFYLTTPIYYVNARPHIGHAYTTIVADVLARRHRLQGDDTFFLTGTDEHGQKIERSAAAAGIPPQQFADEVSAQFRALWDRMGLTYNKFIRTTDEAHKQGAQKLFRELYERGFIYLSTYTGSYCVSDEAFVDLPAGTPCPDCGRVLETVTEENFFFKLSSFQLPLLNLIESGQIAITPPAARNEVLSFLRGGAVDIAGLGEPLVGSPVETGLDPAELQQGMIKGFFARSESGEPYYPGALKDLSISRSTFTWGIPVPPDVQKAAGTTENHVIYVWFDALANYITALGHGSDDPTQQVEFQRYWPADLHLVGKEITRFHCVYWPALLLAAGLAAPKQITANGWLLFDNAKMSKSRGNVVRTETILDAFGDHVYGKQFPDSTKRERDLFAADVLRYFLLREIPFGQDGSFSFDALVTRYNADLANGYGNLVSRTTKLISSALSDAVRTPPPARFSFYEGDQGEDGLGKELWFVGETAAVDAEFKGLPLGTYIDKLYAKGDLYGAARDVGSFIRLVDGFISANEPWRLVDSSDTNARVELERTLYTAAEAIRIITALLYPVLPYATGKVWAQLGLGDIEVAAKNGELNNLEWGGLKPGTKLGPLSPIFPRADKGLSQLMIDMEEARTTPSPKDTSVTRTAPLSTDPGAPPRTSASDPVAELAGTLPVGGSTAVTTALPTSPGLHAETPAGTLSNHVLVVGAPAVDVEADAPIAIDDFMKVDLRVAEIVAAERIPKADKLLRLEVDLGPAFTPSRRQILSGIAQHYAPEELIGRRIVVVANLAPRKMRGLDSHGMLLAASEGPDGKPILATFSDDIALGSRVR